MSYLGRADSRTILALETTFAINVHLSFSRKKDWQNESDLKNLKAASQAKKNQGKPLLYLAFVTRWSLITGLLQ